MKLAIMQPYVFPYLGYFQLIGAVDRFVLYDDVAFIKRGWVNRNRILVNGEPHLFSVPLENASQNRSIRDTLVSRAEFPRWRDKFLRTVDLAYAKAPCYRSTRLLLEEVLQPEPESAADLARRSIEATCKTLGITTPIIPSSTQYGNSHLHAQDRILDICARESATLYINPPGGRELYTAEPFAAQGLELRFISSKLPPYPQGTAAFVPALSIIDVLMFNSPESAREMLPAYILES